MILTGAIIAGLIAAYAAIAGIEAYRLGIAFRQALLYAPFKLVWRIDDRGIRLARKPRRRSSTSSPTSRRSIRR